MNYKFLNAHQLLLLVFYSYLLSSQSNFYVYMIKLQTPFMERKIILVTGFSKHFCGLHSSSLFSFKKDKEREYVLFLQALQCTTIGWFKTREIFNFIIITQFTITLTKTWVQLIRLCTNIQLELNIRRSSKNKMQGSKPLCKNLNF